MASLFSSFIKPGTFLFVSGISYVLSVIVRIKSTYNTFHDIVNIVTFYVIYEAISIDILYIILDFSRNNDAMYSW